MLVIISDWLSSNYLGSGTDKDHSDPMRRNISSEALENGAIIGKVRWDTFYWQMMIATTEINPPVSYKGFGLLPRYLNF